MTLELESAPARISVDESRARDNVTTALTIYRIGPTGREERVWKISSTMTLNRGGDALGGVSSFFPTSGQAAHVGYTITTCGANCNSVENVVVTMRNGVMVKLLDIVADRASYEWDGSNLDPSTANRIRAVVRARARLADAHKKDVATGEKYGVHYTKYWLDEQTGRIHCLVDAPDRDAAVKVHREAHGLLADEIYEVKEYS